MRGPLAPGDELGLGWRRAKHLQDLIDLTTFKEGQCRGKDWRGANTARCLELVMVTRRDCSKHLLAVSLLSSGYDMTARVVGRGSRQLVFFFSPLNIAA